MKILNLPTLALAVVTTFLCSPARLTQGGEEFKEAVDSKEVVDLGTGKFAAYPFHVSISVRGGYDDNVNLNSFDEHGSPFASVQLGLSYNFGNPRTAMSLSAGAGVTYFFDGLDDTGDSDNHAINSYIAFAITHKATPRLTLSANMYGSYQTGPGFQTFDFRNIAFGRQSQDYFFTVNKFSLGYAWTPRFSTMTSYTLGYTNYDDEQLSQFEDRFEHTLGNEFRFLVLPTTTLIAEYRFALIDYTETNARNSTSHYILGGVDHSFSPRFNLSFRGGVEIREYENDFVDFVSTQNGNTTNPYGELTINYAVAQNTSLAWTNRYWLAESNVGEYLNSDTFRTVLSLGHSFTPRIRVGLNFAFENANYDGNLISPSFTENSVDALLWARYTINRNWAVDLGYNYTQVISEDALFREYTRNRVYGGVTFTF